VPLLAETRNLQLPNALIRRRTSPMIGLHNLAKP
jgi:hypothetical protein